MSTVISPLLYVRRMSLALSNKKVNEKSVTLFSSSLARIWNISMHLNSDHRFYRPLQVCVLVLAISFK